MNRFQTAVGLLFSPKYFLLYLVASLTMAVLGNAVYQVLLEKLNSNAFRLALVALFVLLLTIVLIAMAIRKEERRGFLEGKPKPTPTGRLVLLVGRPDVCRKAIAHHGTTLKDCRLICSEQTREVADALRSEFAAICKALPEVIQDVNDPHEAFVKVAAILEVLGPKECAQTICDYTGMTAHISIGMFWASHKYGARLQYTPAAFDEKLKPVGTLDPIEVILSGVR